jgi:dipeptidyl-peptidase-4
MLRNFLSVTVLLLWFGPVANLAQPSKSPAPPTELTVATLQSYEPQSLGSIQWQDDGRGYFKVEPADAGKKVNSLVRYDAATGDRSVLLDGSKLVTSGAAQPLDIEQFQLSRDQKRLLIFTNSKRVWRSNTRGDYWIVDVERGTLRKLGGSAAPSTLMFAKFSPDETLVGYVRENNLYVERLSDGRIRQLTTDGTRHLVNGTFDWVYEEELFCRDGWRWSPDGKRIAYWQLDTSGVKEYTLLNDTAGLYPEISSFPYPKAGETNSAARIGIVKASGGKTRWLEVPGDSRQHYLPRMDWAADSREVVVQQLNRAQNTNVVMLGDAVTGKVRTVLTEHDDAWVDLMFGRWWEGGGGLGGGNIEWINDGRRFLWASERDGWRHVYSVSRDGADIQCITSGDYDVIGVDKVDEAGGWLYIEASPQNPTQRYLFRVPLTGGSPEQLSPADQAGSHRYSFAPRGGLAVHVYSRFTRVPTVDIVRLPEHASVRTLIDNEALKARLAGLKLGAAEFFRVDIGGGVALDGWMITPPDFDRSRHYPVLFYTYGEPAGQTVVDEWGPTMWHEMLAERGYIIMSVDNRGTPAPRGRAWRKAIYRKLGVLNGEDQANAARAIAKWPFVDGSRIGIWGWSGGGSTSLNAIFRYPDVYRMAIAVAPVPDIHYYDTIYQERYCGLPQDHPDEYKQSSPITFASQLKGALLIVHGTGDDNVHYQGTEALIDALVAADKPFTMMAYPNRTHGLYEGPGTIQHLFGLLTTFVMEKL